MWTGSFPASKIVQGAPRIPLRLPSRGLFDRQQGKVVAKFLNTIKDGVAGGLTGMGSRRGNWTKRRVRNRRDDAAVLTDDKFIESDCRT
jgi:hypothetical protein